MEALPLRNVGSFKARDYCEMVIYKGACRCGAVSAPSMHQLHPLDWKVMYPYQQGKMFISLFLLLDTFS
jgi:hypothetical protein